MRREERGKPNGNNPADHRNPKSRPPRNITFSVPDLLTVRQEPGIHDEERYGEEKGNREAQLAISKRLNRATVCGIVISVISLLTVYFGFYQTRESNKTELRPWVGLVYPNDLTSETIFDPLNALNLEKWHYRVRNYGNSPALKVRGHARIYWASNEAIVWKEVQSQIESLPLEENRNWTLFNGAEMPDEGKATVAAPYEIVDQVNKGQGTVFLGGRFEYFDEFGKAHHTTFCVIYVPAEVGKYPGWYGCPIFLVAD